MKLKEFEGKQLFHEAGINIPKGIVIASAENIPSFNSEMVVKAQTLQGKRNKHNGIIFCKNENEIKSAVQSLLNSTLKEEKVTEVLIEEKINVENEYYLGFFFDTKKRNPVVIISKEGGVDIEEIKENNPEKVLIKDIDVLEGLPSWKAREICEEAGFGGKTLLKAASLMVQLYCCFKNNDMKMVEINPLVEDKNGDLIAADAVVVLDDDGLKRHKFNFPKRTGLREQTPREIAAKKIDEDDYKGVAGKTFVDLEGDIAVLASGGGASIVAMDALLSYGGKPANYTEYSGNPPLEKVYKLTKIVLNKENLAGCWVVGGTANFTRIDLTLKGFLDALLEIKPRYPIVVRRAGPGDKEAFEMLRKAAEEHNFNIHLYDETVPITLSAKYIVELSEEYKNGNIS